MIKPIPLRTPVPGGFTSDDFTIDFDARTSLHLARAASAAQLIGEFHELSRSGGADRMSARQQSTGDVHRSRAANARGAVAGEFGTLARSRIGLAENAGGSLGDGPAACVVTILAAPE